MDAVEAKKKYEFLLIEHGASFVAADPDRNELIVGVKDPSVVEWAKKHIPVKIKFVNTGGMSAW